MRRDLVEVLGISTSVSFVRRPAWAKLQLVVGLIAWTASERVFVVLTANNSGQMVRPCLCPDYSLEGILQSSRLGARDGQCLDARMQLTKITYSVTCRTGVLQRAVVVDTILRTVLGRGPGPFVDRTSVNKRVTNPLKYESKEAHLNSNSCSPWNYLLRETR